MHDTHLTGSMPVAPASDSLAALRQLLTDDGSPRPSLWERLSSRLSDVVSFFTSKEQ